MMVSSKEIAKRKGDISKEKELYGAVDWRQNWKSQGIKPDIYSSNIQPAERHNAEMTPAEWQKWVCQKNTTEPAKPRSCSQDCYILQD